MAVMIGVDPHKGSHTASTIDECEVPLGSLRVRAAAGQVAGLLEWAAQFEQRTWAVEGAGGIGYLLAQQLVSAGERVVDVQPKLAARLLATASTNKNDPNDARSVAVAALRSPTLTEVHTEDHAAVMKIWAKRHRDLGSHRTRVACRLHAVLCELVPGGYSGEIYAAKAAQMLDELEPQGAVGAARHDLARDLLADLVSLDEQRTDTKRRIAAIVAASKTTSTEIFGVGPIVAANVIKPRHPHGRHHPNPEPSQRRARLLRPQDRRGQDRQRSDPCAQAAHQRRHLQPSPRRRSASRPSQRRGPGRADGERL